MITKAVCIFDPAVADRIKADRLIEYAQSRDFQLIQGVIDPANPPTIYHFRSLPRSIKHRFVDIEPS